MTLIESDGVLVAHADREVPSLTRDLVRRVVEGVRRCRSVLALAR